MDWGNAGKRPFIMLHGINRTGHSFDKVAPLLQNDYHVIAMTLRGHGDSDWSPKHEYLAEHHASDLHALIEQLKLRDVVLNGNSMGGRVVQVYAGQHPERVWKVIVDDVGPERPESVTKTLTSRIGQETEGWASEEELLKSIRGNRTRTPEQEQDLVDRVRHESKRLPNGRVVWKYDPNITAGLGPVELWQYVKQVQGQGPVHHRRQQQPRPQGDAGAPEGHPAEHRGADDSQRGPHAAPGEPAGLARGGAGVPRRVAHDRRPAYPAARPPRSRPAGSNADARLVKYSGTFSDAFPANDEIEAIDLVAPRKLDARSRR